MNELQTILEDSAIRLFDSLVHPSLLEEAENGTWHSDLWKIIEEHGFADALTPESTDGYGESWHDAYFIVRAAGRYRLPVPLPETMLARWLLSRSGIDMPTRPLTVARPGPELRLARHNGGWRLSGTVSRAPWGRMAHTVVLTFVEDGTVSIVSSPIAGAEIHRGTNLAGECRDTLVFSNHPVEVATWRDVSWMPEAGVLGAMLRSAQIAGGLSGIVELAVTYANDRQQFGRPIGKFQAVQQNLAVLASEAAAAGVAAEAAFRAADRHEPSFLAAAAKVRAAEAATKGAAIAHQVHGAIGFTREYPLHWITRRLAAWRSEFGGEREWAIHLGQRVMKAGADGFWAELTSQMKEAR
ncbi:MAG: acyl-CoA dehydrogenase [Xanthobacteraceae bacterium]|nr:MAG: acyl-CoA dehydrogenase [Xanthobacteraceae bacterium]